MITKILLIRHAQSIANEKDLFGGITDYPLSEKGKIQAQNLVNRLKDIEIDEIYSSPLIRTKQTIQPMSKKLNKEIKIEDDLREIYVGTWEGKPREELRKKYPKINKKIDETEYYTGMEGQEETAEVAKRMVKVITKIARENEGKTIVIMSHCVAIRAFLCEVLEIPFEQTKSKIGDIENTSITFIDYNNESNQFKVLRIGSI